MSKNTEDVVVTRSPRFVRFMVLGFVVGTIVALIATFAWPNSSEFSTFQVFGFLWLCALIVFGALGLVVALIFNAYFAKRTIVTQAVHEVEKS